MKDVSQKSLVSCRGCNTLLCFASGIMAGGGTGCFPCLRRAVTRASVWLGLHRGVLSCPGGVLAEWHLLVFMASKVHKSMVPSR